MFMKRKILKSMEVGKPYTVSEIAKKVGCDCYEAQGKFYRSYDAYEKFYHDYLIPLEIKHKITIDTKNTYTIVRVK